MIQRYGFFFLLLLVSSLSAAAQNIPVKGSGATLDVATWNIEWFGASNGPSNDALQLSNVKAVIEQSAIDLWALQELADQEDFDALLDMLGDNYDGVRADNDCGTSFEQRIGFIWKTDLFTIQRLQPILTSSCFEFAQRLPLQLDARIALPDTTVEITFITVHMKATGDNDSYNRRVAASGLLKNQLDFLLRTTPVVVLGDFNDELGRSISSGRTSPYVNFLDDPEDYAFTTLPLDQQNLATFCGSSSACTSGSTLDHILLTDELFDAYMADSGDRFIELTSSINNYVNTTSDHLPVIARFYFDDTGVSTEQEELPTTITVKSAFPNPFEQSTTLTYSLPEPTYVRIEVFDMLGRQVAMPANGFASAGTHQALFDARNLPPGIYLMRLSAEDFVRTQRIVRL